MPYAADLAGGAWHVARAGLLYLSYHMFRDEVEAAGERN